ncbi:histidine kinase [Desulfatibacillum aliphaticivorans]|uniref:histidine kinase n=1 Tax=Desulfatibacillum aliphaticivorans TaxID=218208 RepID=B8FFC0_DESAL|nr:HAMP domain-containing sensor histidine kinase [Desulfatibacillum aliphaticivorans]ACL04180.1 histidine kinase [Desulfatibacillum aliphaticivorans]
MSRPAEHIGASDDTIKSIELLDQAYSALRHELANSVNSLKITLQVLAAQYNSFDEAKRSEYLDRALGQVARQQHFIEKLRSYSAPEPENRPVPLLVFWSDYLIPVSERLARLNIGFSQDCSAGACMMSADKDALARVLDCLIDNAVDALQDVDRPKISLTAQAREGRLVISVEDNGKGVMNEHHKKILVPLFSTKEGGDGLGLSTSYRIVAKMGGELRVISARGQGATVEVWLNTMDSF